jgi:hypothetical protein
MKNRKCGEVQPSGQGVEERRKHRRQGSEEVERTEEGEPQSQSQKEQL